MKRTITFLCTMAIACSAMAVNHAPSLKKQVVKETSLNFPQVSKSQVITDFLNADNQAVVNTSAMRKAPGTSMNLTDLIAFYWGSISGYTADDWAFQFFNGNNLVFYADVYNIGDGTHIDGTYRMADGDIATGAFVVVAAGDTLTATDATITVQHNTATNYHFDITYTTSRGDYTFNGDIDVTAVDYAYYYYCQEYGLYCEDMIIRLQDQPFELTDEEVNITFTEEVEVNDDYLDEDGLLYFQGYDEGYNYGIGLDIAVTEAIAGHYTDADLTSWTIFIQILHDENGDFILDANGEPMMETIEIYSADLTIAYDGAEGTITGTIIGENGVTYHITMPFEYTEFALTGEEYDITIVETVVDADGLDRYGDIIFSGYSADSIFVALDIIINDGLSGTYTEQNSYLNNADYSYIQIGEEYIALKYATVTIDYTAPNGTITARLTGKDGNVYNVTMSFEYVDNSLSGNEYTVDFGVATVDDSRYSEWGAILFSATATDGTVLNLDVFVKAGLSGTYNQAALFGYTSNLIINDEVYLIKKANFTITYNNPNGTVSGNLTLENGDVYHFTFTFVYAIATGIDNITTTTTITKRIVNGQLVIEKDGKQYNAAGVQLH